MGDFFPPPLSAAASKGGEVIFPKKNISLRPYFFSFPPLPEGVGFFSLKFLSQNYNTLKELTVMKRALSTGFPRHQIRGEMTKNKKKSTQHTSKIRAVQGIFLQGKKNTFRLPSYMHIFKAGSLYFFLLNASFSNFLSCIWTFFWKGGDV